MDNIPPSLRDSIERISKDMKELGLCIIIVTAFTIYELLTYGVNNWVLGFKILFILIPVIMTGFLLLTHSILHDIGESLRMLNSPEHGKFRWTVLMSIHYLAISFMLIYVNTYIVVRSF